MNDLDFVKNAKEKMTICKMCRICNGEVCRGMTPGPGGKGSGSTFIRNVEAFKRVQIKMSVIGHDVKPDTNYRFFSSLLSSPIMAAPISNVKINYGSLVDEQQYLDDLVNGSIESNILCFLGDSPSKTSFDMTLKTLQRSEGNTIMTIKPWEKSAFLDKLDQVLTTHPLAIAIDIDAGGLSSLRSSSPKVEFMTLEDIRNIKAKLGHIPLILKGIMTTEDARLALEANVDAIIVSNHGGRVMDCGESSLEVLQEIATLVNHRCVILMDGGIRNGTDVFKALALGADAVLIGRPYSHASIGSGKEGVVYLTSKMIRELKDTMMMTQCKTLSDINIHKINSHFDF